MAGSTQEADSFDKEARRVVHLIANSDLKAFIGSVSGGGLTVVRRTLDERQLYKPPQPLKEPLISEGFLRFEGQEVVLREEVEVGFAAKELGSVAFRRLFRYFSLDVRGTLAKRPSEITTSLGLWTNTHQWWHAVRYVGPAVQGRAESGSDYWRVCFRREREDWRVWLLEVQYDG